MSEQFHDYQVSEFSGQYPDVPVANGVDIDALRQTDPDPLFVTLPVVSEIGKVSNNGLRYDAGLVGMIEEQINNNRPGALFGHIPKDRRDSDDPIPAGTWIGAKQEGGKLWAKAYIPPGAARDHFRTMKALGRRIATSIWGEGKFEKLQDGTRRAASFTLQSLDFASPERAALGGGHVPIFTAEMTQQGEEDMTRDELIAELTASDIPETLRAAIVAEASKQSGEDTRIAELTSKNTAQGEVIAELKQSLEAVRRERVMDTVVATVAELTDWHVTTDEDKAKLNSLRDMLKKQITMRLGDELDASKVAELATAAFEDIKPIAELVRDALAGPAAIVNGKPHGLGGSRPKIDESPEALRRSMDAAGITV